MNIYKTHENPQYSNCEMIYLDGEYYELNHEVIDDESVTEFNPRVRLVFESSKGCSGTPAVVS